MNGFFIFRILMQPTTVLEWGEYFSKINIFLELYLSKKSYILKQMIAAISSKYELYHYKKKLVS